jgi:hypothetical protein
VDGATHEAELLLAASFKLVALASGRSTLAREVGAVGGERAAVGASVRDGVGHDDVGGGHRGHANESSRLGEHFDG